MKKILLTGGTGLIGQRMASLLTSKGYEVALLSRSPEEVTDYQAYGWDVRKGFIDAQAVDGTYAVIHLAGAGIADKRWTEARRKLIIDSRVKSARLLYTAFSRKGIAPEVVITASGINYYGCITSEHIFTEEDPAATDFTGVCCQLWEQSADLFAQKSRVVKLRTAMVLSTEGGALPRLALPVKLGVGTALGDGEQWVPYIHIDDLCALYLYALEHTGMSGAYNACPDDHIKHKHLLEALSAVLQRPLWLPRVPAFALKLVLGEMADLVLKGSRASAQKVLDAGFTFSYPQLEAALKQLYRE